MQHIPKTHAYIGPGHATYVRAELGCLLKQVLPQGLEKYFFTTSGTYANEAVKIARLVAARSKIIARYRSYHGSTDTSIALTGDPRHWFAESVTKGQGVVFAPEVNCFACPIEHTYPGCGIACVDYVEHIIENENDVAAVLVEPIAGTNGVLVPPPEYFPGLSTLRKTATKEPMKTNAEKVQSRPLVTDKVAAAMMKGVSVMSWVSHFVIGPPLIIEKSGIDFGVSVMDRALEIADQYVVA
jgi:4-aminobutyrate aminotransferase-like enzyme